jgi:hypothetical protein
VAQRCAADKKSVAILFVRLASLVKTLDDEEFDEQISQARDALQPKIRVILAEKIL